MKKINYSDYKRVKNYLELVEGENRVRLISDGFHGEEFRMKTAKTILTWYDWNEVPAKYRPNVEGLARWIWIAINRTTGQVGVLNAGPTIGDEIVTQIQKSGSDPMKVEFLIKRVGTDRNTQYPVVQMQREIKPYTQEEQELIKFKREYLISKYLPQ